MIIGVTGGREYPFVDRVFAALDYLHRHAKIHRVVSGACCDIEGEFRGADRWAMKWAARRQVIFIGYPAPFEAFGRAGGPIRNEYMLRTEKPHYLLWFPGGNGTESCKQFALQMHIPLINGEEIAGHG